MKLKLTFAVSLLVCFALFANAQNCVPNTSDSTAGMYPSSAVNIPAGCPGQFYQTTITLVVPADTTVFGFLYVVDSAVLMNVTGLPAGLTATCEPPNCLWTGGTFGCILISGTLPAGGGSYPISFDFVYHASGAFGPLSIPQAFPNQYLLTVDSIPTADFSSQIGCGSDSVMFMDNSSHNVDSWFWDFGDGSTSSMQNPKKLYAAAGSYTVCLVASGLCGSDTACQTIVVAGPLVADAGGDQTIYLGNTATLGGSPPASGGTPPYSYVWLPGTDLDNQFVSNPVTSTTVDMSYVLFVTDGAGCSASDTVIITVDTTSCDTIPMLWTSNVKYNGAKLNWVGVGNAYSYIIRGREVGAANWRTLRLPNGHPTQRNVFGLENNTTYEWQVSAQCDEEGELTSAWSDLDVFTTGCFGPDSNWETSLAPTSAVLQWTPINGVAGYEINGRISGSPTWQVKYQGPYFSWKTVNNLAPGVTYEWRVRSICEPDSVESAWSSNSVFTTPTSVRQLKETDEIRLFPNPADELVRIDLGLELMGTISIRNAAGSLVKVLPARNVSFVEVSLDELQSGMYFVQVETAEFSRIEKLMISK